MPLGQRLAYWALMLLGVGCFIYVGITLALLQARLAAVPRPAQIALGAIAGAVPGTAVAIFVDAFFRPPMMPTHAMWLLWAQISAIGFVIGVIEFNVPAPTRRASKTGQPPVVLLDQLPPEIGTDIVSLSMHDHYVEVTTTRGHHMLLMRMRDAVDALDGLDGFQIHRSHWVARRHAAQLERDGQRYSLGLSDGRSLPVSATYLDKVRRALRP